MSKIELKENLKKYSNLDECPIRNIISRFSGKWPVIILCILSENECTRFNQIQKAIPDISPKVLSDTLKNLETDGIIKRIVYGEVPPRVEYSLTKLGLSLMPYINNIFADKVAGMPNVVLKMQGEDLSQAGWILMSVPR